MLNCVQKWKLRLRKNYTLYFLEALEALEVIRVTYWVTNLLSVSIDFTDVTLVSEDTYRRLHWCDPDDHNDHDDHDDLMTDESYLMMKVT